MKLSIIIPVYNEEKTVGKVLDKILKLNLNGWDKETIVVNDCSTDKTPQVLKKYKNITVVNHVKNQGKGASIRTGFSLATGNYYIIQDADLEYDPEDIKRLLVVARQNSKAVIYGSRFLTNNEDTVFGHKFGNVFLTFLTNLFFGSKLSDMETCYKLIPQKIIKKFKIDSQRFNFEPEITSKILRLGVSIIEIPISYKKRGFTQGKKIHWFKDGIPAVLTLIKYRLFL